MQCKKSEMKHVFACFGNPDILMRNMGPVESRFSDKAERPWEHQRKPRREASIALCLIGTIGENQEELALDNINWRCPLKLDLALWLWRNCGLCEFGAQGQASDSCEANSVPNSNTAIMINRNFYCHRQNELCEKEKIWIFTFDNFWAFQSD